MKELAAQRGEIIEKFNNVELLLSSLIARHYVPIEDGISIGFLREVLYDEYFSFGLKVRILEKVLEGKERWIQDLRRMGNIRNIFAHTGTMIRKKTETKDILVNLSKSSGNDCNYKELYTEFIGKSKNVEEKLGDLLMKFGVSLLREDQLE